PAMYIGSTGEMGLHHRVWEVVDNSVDEALAGFADEISVTVHPDESVTVVDNGRGIPVDMHQTEKRPAAEVVMTVLHAGGKFDSETYKVSGGLHGVGVSVVNALTDERTEKNAEFRFTGGIAEFVKHLNRGKSTLHDSPIYMEGKRGNVEIEIALQYNDTYGENVFAFANTINTVDGGTHLSGFRSALTRSINNFASQAGMLKE